MPREVIEEYGREWELTAQTIEYDIYEPRQSEDGTCLEPLGNQIFKNREDKHNGN